MGSFTHLHIHTEYSLLDGACRINELVSLAKKLGQQSLAITDHGVMYGAVAFYKAAKQAGIKPIIGCEVYVAPRSRFNKTHSLDSERYHLILLCKSETGYKNLLKLVSSSWVDGFYTKPRVDRDLLEEYHEGLIALSGCLFGEVARNILARDFDSALKTAQWYLSVFGEGNYYLEVQNHGMPEEREVIEGALKISGELGIPLAATNDVHYCTKKDADIQRVLIAIQTNKTLGEDTGLDFANDEFYLKSEDEMRSAFDFYPEAVENTAHIAEKCNFDFEFGVTKLPLFDIPDPDHAQFLKNECISGLNAYFGGKIPADYYERLTYELSVIHQMGFDDYFLIVADFIKFAKSEDIPVGPGRGSAAGSLAAFSLGITGIDPIKNKLLFERFLNPERVSMPDIDIDFCYERRGEVIDYVTRKYGADRVAQIVTFGTLQAKAAVRDVARALGLPYSTGDAVAKQISRDYADINAALSKNAELRKMYDTDDNIRKIIDIAVRIEGMPRHASTHAAGVVITRDEVSSYVPLAKNGDQPVTQYTMTEIEQLGLLKMDFLGLRTLTVINDCIRWIKKKEPDFDIEKISLDDKQIFDEMSKGNTLGIFQCESAGMTNLITNMKPAAFSDIAAAIALFRPGPMYFIDDYLKNRGDSSKIKYKSPLLKDILDETNGCMVYQEQVMQVFRTLAGYSYGRADIVRRAMSKKKHDAMESEREIFINGLTDENGNVIIEGALRRGLDADTADSIFSDMTSFASYGFNKSHTAAYGLIAYRTAYLKIKYPKEFMAALLTSVIGEEGKTAVYINECSRLGIKVIPPHINISDVGFSVSDDGIVFGLLGIKNIGRGLITKIISERSSGLFTSYWDFCKRVYGLDLNKRALEGLVKGGALDSLGMTRRAMILNIDTVTEAASKENSLYAGGQLDIFSMSGDAEQPEPELKPADEYEYTDLLNFEKEASGLYFSGHPLEAYSEVSAALECPRSNDLFEMLETGREENLEGLKVNYLCIITSVKKKVTKNDDVMAFCEVEDLFGSLEMILFPKTLAAYLSRINVGNIILVEGRLSVKDDELKLIPDRICDAPKSAEECKSISARSVITPGGEKTKPEKKKRRGLFIKVETADEAKIRKCRTLLSIFEGDMPVYIFSAADSSYSFLGKEYLTSPNQPMIKELKLIFGENNVVLQR